LPQVFGGPSYAVDKTRPNPSDFSLCIQAEVDSLCGMVILSEASCPKVYLWDSSHVGVSGRSR